MRVYISDAISRNGLNSQMKNQKVSVGDKIHIV